MIKIRRRKPIFEDDQITQQQPSATGTTAQPAATPAPANNTVVPVFKMYTSVSINRKEVDQKLVYTKYIVK